MLFWFQAWCCNLSYTENILLTQVTILEEVSTAQQGFGEVRSRGPRPGGAEGIPRAVAASCCCALQSPRCAHPAAGTRMHAQGSRTDPTHPHRQHLVIFSGIIFLIIFFFSDIFSLGRLIRSRVTVAGCEELTKTPPRVPPGVQGLVPLAPLNFRKRLPAMLSLPGWRSSSFSPNPALGPSRQHWLSTNRRLLERCGACLWDCCQVCRVHLNTPGVHLLG